MKKRSPGKKRTARETTVTKGRVLERIAALMHNQPNITVELNRRLPPLNGKGIRREIDVLLTGNIAGYPVKIAIECKNENKPIGSPKIDAFIGKLQYVGIPPQYGIFISATGYTTGAIERANAAGMKVLTLQGLTDENLLGSIVGAFQSIIYLLLQIVGLNVTNEVPPGANSQIDAFSFYNEDGKLAAILPDFIWRMWISGKIPTAIGEHEIEVPLPPNLNQMVNGKPVATFALGAKVRIFGLAVTLEGQTKEYTLVNAATKALEKNLIDISFNANKQELPVTAFQSEEQLQEFIFKPRAIQLTVGRISLPRIIYQNMYWPPSERATQIIKERLRAYEAGEISSPVPVDIQEIEGTDLGTIWEPISERHPAGQWIGEIMNAKVNLKGQYYSAERKD